MNELGASPFLLSLMATSAALPFFLFALPAGVISDLVNRQILLIATYLWLAAAAGALALFTWLHLVKPYYILITAFLLGVGYAFAAPAWAAIIPEVVPKSELPSAIILSGVQMNLGGIVGPALGGLLLSVAGPGIIFSLNALVFLFAAMMVKRWYRERRRFGAHLEGFMESFASTARCIRYTPGIQVILTRDFLFGFFIAEVPALLPVVAFRRLHLQANQLGLSFTCLGIGSLLGGALVLPYARTKFTPNTLTIIGIGTLDSGPAGHAGLGPGTNERGAHDGVARRSSTWRASLGLVSNFSRTRQDAGGRSHSPWRQPCVGDSAFDQLCPFSRPRVGPVGGPAQFSFGTEAR